MVNRIGSVALCVVVWFVAVVAQQATQPQTPGTGLIMGRVVSAGTDEALPGIMVTITGQPLPATPQSAPTPPRRVVTDDKGRYVFRQLRSGRYSIAAEMQGTGYSPNGFMVGGIGQPIGAFGAGGDGQPFFGGPLQPIDLADGARIGNSDIGLFRTGALSGTVRDENGDPLVDAVVGAVQVSSSGEFLNGPTGKTDDRGRYRFGSLAPGRYVVFVPQTQVLMPPSLVERIQAGTDAQSVQQRLAGTASLGVSFSGLGAGTSLLAASSVGLVTNSFAPRTTGAATFAYQTTFSPAAVSPDLAGIVTLASGDERDGIDVQLTPVRTASVSGTLWDAAEPAATYTVHLLPQGSIGASLFEVASAPTDQAGRFEFPFVPVGQYTLAAMRFPDRAAPLAQGAKPPPEHSVPHSGMPGASVMQSIGVGEDGVTNVTLTMKPGVTLKIQTEFVGAAMPDDRTLRNFSVLARPARPALRYQGQSPLAYADPATGVLRMAGVIPGRYALQPAYLQGWWLQSVTVGGVEISDAAFEFTSDRADVVLKFAAQPLTLSGTVHDDKGAADLTAAVAVFPADRARWADARISTLSFQLARPTKAGAFNARQILPGDYIVAAVRAADLEAWPDTALLTKLAAVGTSVRVTPGASATVSLTTKVLR